MINLALLYNKMDKYSDASMLIKKALSVYQQNGIVRDPAYLSALNSLGDVYTATKSFDKALATYLTAIENNALCEITVSIPEIDKLLECEFAHNSTAISTLRSLAALSQKNYDVDQKPIHLEQKHQVLQIAITLNSKIRTSFNADEDKLRVLEDMSSLVSMTLENSNLLSKQNQEIHLNTVFSNAEQNKSILLGDALKGQNAHAFGDLPEDLIQQEKALKEERSNLKKELLQSITSEERAALINQQSNLVLKVNNFRQLLKDKYPKYHALKYANNVATINDIQNLLSKDQALIEYFVSESILYAFYIDKQKANLHRFELSLEQLNEKTQGFRSILTDYALMKKDAPKAFMMYTEAASWLYTKMMGPILEDVEGINHLIIVPDGNLTDIPFEIFLTEKGKTEDTYKTLPYLLKSYKISYTYSATLWKENIEQISKVNNNKILAMSASYTGSITDEMLRSNRSAEALTLRDALSELPAAIEEVNKLSALFKGSFWKGEQTNEQNFKKNAGEYAVLHLAMHGLLNKENPMLSSLAFSENGDSTEDNFLEAWEIARLQLNADLVVLSACETGYGKFQQGEGSMSLARSFMYAGVPSLVVSLWQVNDLSTSFIMQDFYTNLAKGMDKAEALKQAKLHYLDKAKGMAAHPAFWAPFIQLGDSRPITVETKGPSSQLWWLVGGGGLLVLTLGGLALRKKRKEA